MPESDQATRATTYAEAMDAATDMAKRRIGQVAKANSAYSKATAADNAADVLDAIRQECASAKGNDRWVAANTLAQLGEHLRQQARATGVSGYGNVERTLREQADACDRAVEELLGRSATRERSNGMAM